jgi:hypothetical protein
MNSKLIRTVLLAWGFTLAMCAPAPVFAEQASDVPVVVITIDDVLGVMRHLPPEGCLYNPHGRGCDRPGGYDRGPDARRIAEAIVKAADGRITGGVRLDAALMATYSSYESGNTANAKGDGGASLGAWQIKYIGETMFDPAAAVVVWRSRAVDSMRVCTARGAAPDEGLASLAGGCDFAQTRRKVRMRLKAARDALAAVE